MRGVVLLESRRSRSTAAPVVSVMLHGGVILLAVTATADGFRPVREPLVESRIHYARPQPAQPRGALVPDRSQSRFRSADASLVPRSPASPTQFQIPDVLPPADASLFDPSVTAELKALASGDAGIGEGLTSGISDSPYRVEEVDVPAAAISGQRGPRYPGSLLNARVEGRVRVRFVVDAGGRAEGVPEILSATRPEFTESVRAYLAAARYRPASVRGVRVAQIVEQEFVFTLRD